jgi:NAD(P)-dependent dehydrogenase (short-subunit alcohol dehydrogenase family)
MTQLFNLDGKTALITGASSGLGAQAARALSRAGARVLLAARRIEKLEELALELGNAEIVPMDISCKRSVLAVFSDLEDSAESIDICVNAAGLAHRSPIFEEDSAGEFEQVMQTNVMGMWYVTKAIVNHMKKRGIHGSIINIGSANGDSIQREGYTAYAASKAAVIQLTKALVGELSPYRIRINCINPGLFYTPLTAPELSSQEALEGAGQQIPVGFVAVPPDLDGLILYLASNEASRYVTGSDMLVDGGLSCEPMARSAIQAESTYHREIEEILAKAKQIDGKELA